jgi:hypothetical protein
MGCDYRLQISDEILTERLSSKLQYKTDVKFKCAYHVIQTPVLKECIVDYCEDKFILSDTVSAEEVLYIFVKVLCRSQTMRLSGHQLITWQHVKCIKR